MPNSPLKRIAFMASDNVMQNAPQRGALIALEGCDRVGKSTHCAMLVEGLKQAGIDAVGLRFPDRTTPTGHLIADYLTRSAELNDKAVHLLFAANRWEARDAIVDLLQKRTTVIVDRYAASGAVFSAAKGMNLDWCCSVDAGLPMPDLTVYLRTPSPAALLASRPGFGQERYETAQFQSRVGANFDRLYDLDRASSSPSWFSVDAALPLKESQALIRQASMKIISDVKNDIRLLWPHLTVKPQ